jgi:monoamine oxidase
MRALGAFAVSGCVRPCRNVWYCRELGVPIEVFTNIDADAYIYNESAGMTNPVRNRTAKADVYGYVCELLARITTKGRSTRS